MDAVIQELQRSIIQPCEPLVLTPDQTSMGAIGCKAAVFKLAHIGESAVFNWRNIERMDQCLATLKASGVDESNVLVQLNYMIFRGRANTVARVPPNYYPQ